MAEEPRTLSRRAVLTSAGMIAGTGLLQAAPAIHIRSDEYTAKKGAVSLAMYRKRPAGSQPLPVLLLVHGSSLSARTSYDLTVPGREEYSR